ncbi:UDP-3-O-(3-hydroxymyristoyl)glucosamine N-acyltransferase [Leptospira wolffii]|uniref:UDP-3-O-(3-hydroxymyristoyl)glucosamine N-acyltransferase n=1 Tax=Leptospira wolffii TaxID=409998 RepID=UPI0010840C90|nr:UDP-3-O-(3-hydroxymyristoyl)glucosamine N-acyltransferase [Leptospira wolffii]TGK62847.1 UDP-3-O-(3-hydroxymyristoyl)glucosamine N-acyltransferase [Leptospira wolffii]TGK65955.1 UDP-3-O-(3-hydroxymyristoyl)glucosamine N-acyltransferase [Leptospira wolffii]TGK74908.1 UDP-3-O-(3-hydroxymyristoyl)glucosamine N-acyltransferase [Leptospira wolffii]TGL31172.1 UDP-3-O-(3-hydroxymyristoyl)glucosamine N-acyltransferase [Leptospira wolffii]
MARFTLDELAAKISGAKIENCTDPKSVIVHSVSPIHPGQKESISFLSNKKMLSDAKNTASSIVLTTAEFAKELQIPCLIVDKPDLVLAQVLDLVYPPHKFESKIEPSAFVHPSAKIGKNVYVGNFVSVGESAEIGDDTILEDGVHIGRGARIGAGSHIGPNNVIHHGVLIGKRFRSFGNCTVGGDGFRFVFANGKHNKIPQVGTVIVGDDVEMGSNSAIDRGGLENTIIGDGCKFDNLVHIGHNCVLGKNVVIAGYTGIAGSTTIGDNVTIGGGCGVADHIGIPSGTIVGGGTSVRNTLPKADIYVGWDYGLTFPEFQKLRVNIKNVVNFQKWARRIKGIESKLGINVEE